MKPCLECGNQFWTQIKGICVTCITHPLMSEAQRRQSFAEVRVDLKQHPERWSIHG